MRRRVLGTALAALALAGSGVAVGSAPSGAAVGAVAGQALPAHRRASGEVLSPERVYLSGERMFGSFRAVGETMSEVLDAPASAQAGPGAPDPWRRIGVRPLMMLQPGPLQVAGGAVLGQLPSPTGFPADTPYVVDVLGQTLSLVPAFSVGLTAGGRYVSYTTPTVSGEVTLRQTQTWRVVPGPVTAGTIAGTRVVSGPDDAGLVTVTPLPGEPGPARSYHTGIACFQEAGTVYGRWALVDCGGTPGVSQVVDLYGERPSWTPSPRLPDGTVFGDGFVVSPQPVTGNPPATRYLSVVDLWDPTHTPRLVGPIGSLHSGYGPGFVLDDNGGHRLAYLDPDAVWRVVDLSWLSAPHSLGDHAAPVLASLDVGPRIGTPQLLRWRFTDDSTLLRQWARYRQAPSGRALGAYVYPPNWQGGFGGPYSVFVSPGTETCWSVRASDPLGNVSAWSGDRCVTSPLDDASVGMRVVGGARRSMAGASGGSATTLARGATLTLASRVAAVQVCVVGWAGPKQGAIDVSLGRIRLGRISWASATTGWRTRCTARGPLRTGALVIRSASGTAAVDAVALLRS